MLRLLSSSSAAVASLRERAAARARLRDVSLKLPPFLKLQNTGGLAGVPPAGVRGGPRSRSDNCHIECPHRLAEYPDPVPTKDLKR